MSDNAIQDAIKWTPTLRVLKYHPETVDDLTRRYGRGQELVAADFRRLEELELEGPDEVVEVVGNALLRVGIVRIANLIVGTGSTPAFTGTQGFVGVGDSTTAVDPVNQTNLVGTNKWYQAIDAAPSVNATTGLISANCTVTGANGNFAWQEWCWGIATGTITAGATTPGTSPVVLNRRVQNLGSKANGAVWTLQASIQLS